MSTDTSGSNLSAEVVRATRAAKSALDDTSLFQLAAALDRADDSAHADYFRAVVARGRADLPPGEWRRHFAREMALYAAQFNGWFGRLAARADGGGVSATRGFPDVLCYDGDLVGDGDTNLGNLANSRGWPWAGRLCVVQRSTLSAAEIVRRLLPLPLLADVFDLDLAFNNVAGPVADALATATSLAHLRGLHLHQSDASAAAVQALVESPLVANLHAFSVSVNGPGLAAVASAPGLTNVRELRIGGDKLAPKDWAALGRSPHLTAVRALDIADTALGAAGMTALAETPLFARLETLDLSGVSDTDAAVAALAENPAAANLRTLTCSGKGRKEKLSSAGLAALAASPHLSNLRALDLTMADIQADGIKALAKSKSITGLERLVLWYNPLGAAAGKALGASPVFAHLNDLRLADCKLGAAGALAVARSPHLNNVRVLNLAGNGASAEVAHAVAQPGAFPRLRALLLGYNKIDDAGVAALARADHLTDLGVLDLSGQGQASSVSGRQGKLLTDVAINALLESPALAEVALLCLSGNAAAWPRNADLAARFEARVHCAHWPSQLYLFR